MNRRDLKIDKWMVTGNQELFGKGIMERLLDEEMKAKIRDFRLPSYQEIPDVGLFLEQVAKYISEYLKPFPSTAITTSMISNYVKKKIISNPVKKQYGREQIAELIFIAVAKTVLSLEEIQFLITFQKKNYQSRIAYDYFCSELILHLHNVFDLQDPDGQAESETGKSSNLQEKQILQNMILTVVYKIYLDEMFAKMITPEKSNAETVQLS